MNAAEKWNLAGGRLVGEAIAACGAGAFCEASVSDQSFQVFACGLYGAESHGCLHIADGGRVSELDAIANKAKHFFAGLTWRCASWHMGTIPDKCLVSSEGKRRESFVKIGGLDC